MSDEWVPVAEAIARLEEAMSIEKEQAIAGIARLVEAGGVESRIANVSDGSGNPPHRNVTMKSDDWRAIWVLENSDWYKCSKASFPGDPDLPDDIHWLGIQVNRGDLELYIASQRPISGAAGRAPSGDKKTAGNGSRKGRPKGSGYQRADAPLIEEMKQLIANNLALNPRSAAKLVAEKAPGASFDAKVDRLAGGFARREKERNAVPI